MKKYAPIVLAVVVFAVALALNRPEPQTAVVVAAVDLPEGRVLSEADMSVKQMPQSLAPQGAVGDPQSLVGQRLRVARSAGDPILPAHLGGEVLELGANERAVALQVSAAQGLAGFLKPGDRVGLTVIVTGNQQTYAKYLVGGLRVLWVDPAFRRDVQPVPQSTPSGGLFGSSAPAGGAGAAGVMDAGGSARGLVVLAVPIDMKVVSYLFAPEGSENVSKNVYLLDLLPVLQMQGAQFGLVLEPEKAGDAQTSGLALQSLMITPGPTLTPTPTGQAAEAAPQSTPTP